MVSELTRELLDLLAPSARAIAPQLEASIAAGVAGVAERWPDAPPPGVDLVRYIIDRARRQADLATALPRLRIEDVFLAWWTGADDARAIAAFERAHAEALHRLLLRFHRLDGDELRQLLRIKLFVGTASAPPRIREYSGFGFLENWFKIVAARTFLDAARSHQRERADELGDDVVFELAASGDGPRDAAARAQLVAVVKRALEAAIAALPPRDRTFLRHATVDGLTLEQIATTYQLHRITVSRALASARQQLREATRAHVIAELGIEPARLASALHLLDSQIDLSLQRLFPEPTL